MRLKIISGGQTGVDRGALDAAITAGVAHGGFCPRGRRAEDQVIPSAYMLTEAPTEAYPARTEMNIRLAHGTLILVRSQTGVRATPGTRLTLSLCQSLGKPLYVADLRQGQHVAEVVAWIEKLARDLEVPDGWLPGIVEPTDELIINVAGSRESKMPGIHDETVDFVGKMISQLRENIEIFTFGS